MAGLKQEVDKIGIVNLASTGKDNAPEASTRGGPAESARGGDRGGPGDRGGGMAPGAGPQGGSAAGQPMGFIASLKHTGGGMGPPPATGFGGPMGMGGGGGGADDREARLAGGLGKAAIGLKADQLELDPSKTYEKLLLDSNSAHNQKLALAQALLQVGDWANASKLLARLSALGVQPAAWQPLGATLCSIVTAELEPITSCLAPKGILARGLLDTAAAALSQPAVAAGGSAALAAALPPALKPGPPVSARATEALQELGMFLYRDIRLLVKVIRAMRHHLLFYGLTPAAAEDGALPPQAAGARAEAARVEEVIGRVLLPACALVPSVPALSHELWELLRLLPYVARYKLYADFRELTDKSPFLTAASKLAVYETRKVLKRLHSAPDKCERKDTCKPHGRMLSKIAATNALPVLETIVQLVRAGPLRSCK